MRFYVARKIKIAVKRAVKIILIRVGLWPLVRNIFYAKEAYINKDVPKKGVDFYSSFLSEGDLVFDVGANYGNRCALFTEIGCQVVAVEPLKKCVSYLRKKYKNSIIVEPVGVSDKPEILEFYISDNTVLSSFSKEYIDKVKQKRHQTVFWNKKINIPCTTLDELIKKHGVPKFVKLDVEGFEYQALKGLSTSVEFVSFEYTTPELVDELRLCIEHLNCISQYKYLYSYSVGETMEFSVPFCSYNDFLDIVSSKIFIDTKFGDVYAMLQKS